MSQSELPIDATMRTEVIEGLLEKIQTYYVFPDVAQQIAAHIRARRHNREYDDLTTASALCERLNTHLYEVSTDKHLALTYSVEPQPPRHDADEKDPAWRERSRQFGRLGNFGFQKAERLAGNIGYLDIRFFAFPEFAGEVAVAALNFVANTHALIIDLRQCTGGMPEMIALVTTYLFEGDPVHLNDLSWREGDRVQQFWTLPHVPGQRYAHQPLFVLTSKRTLSGAEEFAYNLKNLKRATLVGEITGGAAHPGAAYQLNPHFEVFIPTGRALNPITGTNWEGTGVIPDLKVPADQALKVAHREALKQVLARLGDQPRGADRALANEIKQTLAELAE